MNGWLDAVAVWLADFQLLGAVLLAVGLAAQWFIRQPVQRLALAKSLLVALALLAALCAMPGWSVVHLLAGEEVITEAAIASVAPLSEAAMADFVVPLPAIADAKGGPSVATESLVLAAAPPEAAWRDVSWLEMLIAIYALGSLAVCGWLMLGAFAAQRLLREATVAPAELVGRMAALVGDGQERPALLISDRVDTAVALGVLRPTVLLPRGWATEHTADTLTTVLAHEWTHIRSGDLRWLALGRGLLVLLWCQPLYWLLRRRVGLDQEALADAVAADVSSREQYAEQLVAWARSMPAGTRISLPAAVGLWEGPSQLRRRVEILLDEKLMMLRRCPRAWALIVTGVVVVSAIGLSMATLEPSAAEVPVLPSKPQVGVARLPSGNAVEVLAIGTNVQSETPDRWWRADGTPLVSTPFVIGGGSVSPDGDQVVRQLVFRVPDLPSGATVQWSGIDFVGGAYLGDVTMNGEESPPGYYSYVLCVSRDQTNFGLRVKEATGQWKSVATSNPQGGAAYGMTEGKSIAITQAFAIADQFWGPSTAVVISDSLADSDVRVVAFDRKNVMQTAGKRSAKSTGIATANLTQFDFLGLAVEDVDRFEVQTRDFDVVEISGLPTQPNANVAAVEFSLDVPVEDGEATAAQEVALATSQRETHHSTVVGSAQFNSFVVGNPPKPWAYQPNKLAVDTWDGADKPLAGVEVEAYRSSPLTGARELVGRSVTNQNGFAEFSDLVAADRTQQYAELAAKSQTPQRLEEMFFAVLRRPGMTTVVLPAWDFEVAAHGIRRGVRMRPAAELTGHVTNQAGEPVAGATVAAGGFVGHFVLEGVNAVKSGSDGRFRFADLVAFDRQAASEREAATGVFATAANRDDARRFPPVYDPAEATSVSDLIVSHPEYAVTAVRGGDVPGTADVVMAPAAAIEGRVVDFATGKPVAGVLVRASGAPRTPEVTDGQLKANSGTVLTFATLHTASTLTDADGRYRLANLPAGTYDVWPEAATDGIGQVGRIGRGIGKVQADADAGPTFVQDIAIGPGGTIRGQLIDADTGKPLTFDRDGATLRAVTFLVDGPGQQSSQSQSVPVTAEGKFELQAIPGKSRMYLIVYQPGENSHPQGDYRSDDKTIETGPIFELTHSESIEVEFPVGSRAEQDKLRAQLMRGYDLLREEKYDEAIEAFAALLAARPGDSTAFLGRAQAFELAGREAEAIADYEALIAAKPDDIGTKERLGRILASTPDASVRNGRRAVELLTDVVAEWRRNPPNEYAISIALSELAAAHAEAGDFEAAVTAQRKAIETSKSEQARDHLQEVLQRYEAKQPYHRSPPSKVP